MVGFKCQYCDKEYNNGAFVHMSECKSPLNPWRIAMKKDTDAFSKRLNQIININKVNEYLGVK